MDRYRPCNIDGNDFSSTAFDDAKKMWGKGIEANGKEFASTIENKHAGRTFFFNRSTSIDRRLGAK